jgi:hypothetical protein
MRVVCAFSCPWRCPPVDLYISIIRSHLCCVMKCCSFLSHGSRQPGPPVEKFGVNAAGITREFEQINVGAIVSALWRRYKLVCICA